MLQVVQVRPVLCPGLGLRAGRGARRSGAVRRRCCPAAWKQHQLGRPVCAAGQPACPQVSRSIGLFGSDREFAALTARSGTRRARRLRSRTALAPSVLVLVATVTVRGGSSDRARSGHALTTQAPGGSAHRQSRWCSGRYGPAALCWHEPQLGHELRSVEDKPEA
jgi:hypothetical protein